MRLVNQQAAFRLFLSGSQSSSESNLGVYSVFTYTTSSVVTMRAGWKEGRSRLESKVNIGERFVVEPDSSNGVKYGIYIEGPLRSLAGPSPLLTGKPVAR